MEKDIVLFIASLVFGFICLFGEDAFDRNVFVNKIFQAFFLFLSLVCMRIS